VRNPRSTSASSLRRDLQGGRARRVQLLNEVILGLLELASWGVGRTVERVGRRWREVASLRGSRHVGHRVKPSSFRGFGPRSGHDAVRPVVLHFSSDVTPVAVFTPPSREPLSRGSSCLVGRVPYALDYDERSELAPEHLAGAV
jgi:hypothetical protein